MTLPRLRLGKFRGDHVLDHLQVSDTKAVVFTDRHLVCVETKKTRVRWFVALQHYTGHETQGLVVTVHYEVRVGAQERVHAVSHTILCTFIRHNQKHPSGKHTSGKQKCTPFFVLFCFFRCIFAHNACAPQCIRPPLRHLNPPSWRLATDGCKFPPATACAAAPRSF